MRASKRLHTAAPKLLAACELALTVFNTTPPDPFNAFVAIERLRDAVEQATGEARKR